MMLKKILLMFSIFAFISCQPNGRGKAKDGMTVFPRGGRGPAEYFSGSAWGKMLHTDENGKFDTQVYNVTFEPAARTYWHSHPGGPILLITKGTGYYQEKGKPARLLKEGGTVAIPPHAVHWHGAAPERAMVHPGMSTQVHLGPAKWAGAVTDEEYAKLG